MIEAKRVTYRMKKNGRTFSLENVDLAVPEGYITCLLGHNGAGKTTLMNLLYGLVIPDSGKVFYRGEPLTKKRLAACHREVIFCPAGWCVSHLSVRRNMEWMSILYPEFQWTVFEQAMERLRAGELFDQPFELLSTGERKKVELAYAAARNPGLLFLDEPFANLDPVVKMEVVELMVSLAREQGTGILVSTHLTEEITDLVDYIAVLEQGHMVEYGDREEVLERHRAADLGELLKSH